MLIYTDLIEVEMMIMPKNLRGETAHETSHPPEIPELQAPAKSRGHQLHQLVPIHHIRLQKIEQLSLSRRLSKEWQNVLQNWE